LKIRVARINDQITTKIGLLFYSIYDRTAWRYCNPNKA